MEKTKKSLKKRGRKTLEALTETEVRSVTLQNNFDFIFFMNTKNDLSKFNLR